MPARPYPAWPQGTLRHRRLDEGRERARRGRRDSRQLPAELPGLGSGHQLGHDGCAAAGLALRGDRRPLPWPERRERLELLARAFEVPFELSPVVEPTMSLAEQMLDGRLEGLVVKDRRSPYGDGSRAGWFKLKDGSWYEREAWRFHR